MVFPTQREDGEEMDYDVMYDTFLGDTDEARLGVTRATEGQTSQQQQRRRATDADARFIAAAIRDELRR